MNPTSPIIFFLYLFSVRRCVEKNKSNTGVILLISSVIQSCNSNSNRVTGLTGGRLGDDCSQYSRQGHGDNWDNPEKIIVALKRKPSLLVTGLELSGQVLSHSLIKVWKNVKHTSPASLTSLTGKQFSFYIPPATLKSRQNSGLFKLTLKAFRRLYRNNTSTSSVIPFESKLNKWSSI